MTLRYNGISILMITVVIVTTRIVTVSGGGKGGKCARISCSSVNFSPFICPGASIKVDDDDYCHDNDHEVRILNQYLSKVNSSLEENMKKFDSSTSAGMVFSLIEESASKGDKKDIIMEREDDAKKSVGSTSDANAVVLSSSGGVTTHSPEQYDFVQQLLDNIENNVLTKVLDDETVSSRIVKLDTFYYCVNVTLKLCSLKVTIDEQKGEGEEHGSCPTDVPETLFHGSGEGRYSRFQTLLENRWNETLELAKPEVTMTQEQIKNFRKHGKQVLFEVKKLITKKEFTSVMKNNLLIQLRNALTSGVSALRLEIEPSNIEKIVKCSVENGLWETVKLHLLIEQVLDVVLEERRCPVTSDAAIPTSDDPSAETAPVRNFDRVLKTQDVYYPE